MARLLIVRSMAMTRTVAHVRYTALQQLKQRMSAAFVELTDPTTVPTNGLQVITGCPPCFKRVRLNVPVAKGQGLLLPIESEVLGEASQSVESSAGERDGVTEVDCLRRHSSQTLRDFLDRMIAMCEQGAHREALQYYECHCGGFVPDPALAEFDRLVGTLRQKLAA